MFLRLFAPLVALAALALVATPAPAAVPGEDLWSEPLAPFKIADNLYYVGSKELTAFLIVTPKGDILLDGGVPKNGPMVLDNVRALGFDPHDIKILINSHAHFDHAGPFAMLKQATGAQMVISRGDAPVIESGGETDFFFHKRMFPPAKVDRVIDDGDTVSLGGVTLTAHITAGHTKGCTSWTLPVTVDGQAKQALFICSLTLLPGYRLTGDPGYPNLGADFARSIATLRAQRCDLFLASHGGFIDLLKKREAMLAGAKTNPFIDPAGCKAYIDHGEASLHRLEARGGQ
ncbi:subclass B3 metallo-beta-lactamase [Phenylobacterium montanum]|uniref:Subclass B3 metallo-beta-lactamase n=1 Tax=Phenylobacterium montanum TaxID=2823693 RepID=A0A975FYE4_9CAUL|nr:subclass B3 metallo-beta-lactamase [Caulobacter sp. S6]QUD87484.1 subclass B3 metallo-beta-lactamase [Caulobacter sp. S6]